MLPNFSTVAAACHFLDVKANPSVYEPGKIIPFSRFFSLQQMDCMGLTNPNESLHCKVSKKNNPINNNSTAFCTSIISGPFHERIPNEGRKLNGSRPCRRRQGL